MQGPGDEVAEAIYSRSLSIYDDASSLTECWYDIATLEDRLNTLLVGLDLDLPIRTRAKVAKMKVAKALGYEPPKSFKKTRPRFPGQNLDISVQMSNNFQVWNEEIDPSRRYGFIQVDERGKVTRVRVVSGEAVALLDKTGTLTSKFQAKRRSERSGSALVSTEDTENFRTVLAPRELTGTRLSIISPVDNPIPKRVLPILEVWKRLQPLVGFEFEDPGLVQERVRGVVLQKAVCEMLELGEYADAGQFPDILSQVIEVKLQLSPTIDLGLVSPDSVTLTPDVGLSIRHCDTRYVIAYGERITQHRIKIESLVLSTGSDFFTEFQRFEGLVQNQKLQIPLPPDFFKTERQRNQTID